MLSSGRRPIIKITLFDPDVVQALTGIFMRLLLEGQMGFVNEPSSIRGTMRLTSPRL